MRIIVSAGHEDTEKITGHKIGQAAADRLRTSTGALGREVEWTRPWADRLVVELRKLGVDAVRVGCIWHDAYTAPADLVLCGHVDGTAAIRAQWVMASPVLSGLTTEAQMGDSRASKFVAAWNSLYPKAVGISAFGPITDNMRLYYGGYYRRPDTPMAILEHGIWGMAGQVAATCPTPDLAAIADAQVVASHYGLQAQATNPFWDQVGPGVKASMLERGDEPLTPERYVKDERMETTFSVTEGRRYVYRWWPASGMVRVSDY